VSKGKIKIPNKDLLIKIFKFISWLDKKKWCKENQQKEKERILKNFAPDLTNSERILTHWLCYITDRQMPFMRVWEIGGLVFSELVQEYKRSKKSLEEIFKDYYEEYNEKNRKKFRFISKRKKDKKGNPIVYASRFVTTDYQHIFQTLEVLDKHEVTINGKTYRRDLVAFILHFIQKFKNEKEKCLRRVACALYLLTYRLDKDKENSEKFKSNVDKILKILRDDKEFEKEFKKFDKKATEGKKRLWASLRNYKKGLFFEIFKEATKDITKDKAEKFIKVWESLPMDSLELPGDRWNNDPRFIKCVLGLKEGDNVKLRNLNMSKLIREIYNNQKYHKELKEIGFYPEQFDVSFDFARKMCEERLCHICPFNNGAKSICVPNEEYCTVALITCGYLAPCDQENCIINKTKKLL